MRVVLVRLYPEIMSEQQRRHYKREFDSELACYKRLCAELDETSDQMHQLSRELDALNTDCVKYQVVAQCANSLLIQTQGGGDAFAPTICFLVTGCS